MTSARVRPDTFLRTGYRLVVSERNRTPPTGPRPGRSSPHRLPGAWSCRIRFKLGHEFSQCRDRNSAQTVKVH